MEIIIPTKEDSALERYINVYIQPCHRDTISLREAHEHARRGGWMFRRMPTEPGGLAPVLATAGLVMWLEETNNASGYYMKRGVAA